MEMIAQFAVYLKKKMCCVSTRRLNGKLRQKPEKKSQENFNPAPPVSNFIIKNLF
jgi:hypothetical protein